MKKMIALCMAAVMSLALLAGCTSADPNNPYGQEPAEGNPGATTEETAAVRKRVVKRAAKRLGAELRA